MYNFTSHVSRMVDRCIYIINLVDSILMLHSLYFTSGCIVLDAPSMLIYSVTSELRIFSGLSFSSLSVLGLYMFVKYILTILSPVCA